VQKGQKSMTAENSGRERDKRGNGNAETRETIPVASLLHRKHVKPKEV